jgi:hypothetical protein
MAESRETKEDLNYFEDFYEYSASSQGHRGTIKYVHMYK